MDWTRAGLIEAGFDGFVRFADLPSVPIPTARGVYLVVRPDDHEPVFLAESAAGWFKGKDPTVDTEVLLSAWVDEAAVVYVGKASNLRQRLSQYRRHGIGGRVGHWGGRYIWQLEEHGRLLVAWKETPGRDPEAVEHGLIGEFVSVYGTRPFANRNLGRAPQTGQAR